MNSPTMQKFAIIGFPLTHSRSPQIHNYAFKELHLKAVYEKLEIQPASFREQIPFLKKADFSGFNVTIPYKQQIIPFLDRLDPLAQRIGAVNTIQVIEKGVWKGYNTDYLGFLKPLQPYSKDLKTCLVIGAGGAARAVAFALVHSLPVRELTLANRNIERAEDLKRELIRFKAINYKTVTLDFRVHRPFDLIVNCTPLGMSGQSQKIPVDIHGKIKPETIVYDLIYDPPLTDFLKSARGLGLKTFNGWPMLIYQAEAAFRIWMGRDFPEALFHTFIQKS